MGLESYSKHGVLIACISIILCIFVCMESLLEMHSMYSYRELIGYTNQSLLMPMITLIISLIMLIFSGFLIFGIVKKRHLCLAPWLISVVIGLCFEIFYVGFFNTGIVRIQIGVILLTIIALEVLMLYPIYILYNDIRYDAEEKSSKKLTDKCSKELTYKSSKELSNNPAEKCIQQMDVV